MFYRCAILKLKHPVENMLKYRLGLCLAILLIISGCSTKAVHYCEIEDNRHIGPCEQIVNKAYRYALLSVNSYEKEENTPFVLPEYVREVRHADSQVSNPSPQYTDSNVYANGSFQAKVFEVGTEGDEAGTDMPFEVVIAYRGTERFPLFDIVDGSLTPNHRLKAIRLYEEIKTKYTGRNARIILTGHSLGGALALEVVYTFHEDDIPAYVFNTSYHLTGPKKLNRLPEGRQVISIEEIGDSVVGPFRLLWNKPKGLRIYRVDYVKNPITGGHSKYYMALGLLQEAHVNGGQEASQIFDMNQKLYQ